MSTTYTTNYRLGKQTDTSDTFDMSVITDNMDVIDTQMKADEINLSSQLTWSSGTYGASDNTHQLYTMASSIFKRTQTVTLEELGGLGTTIFIDIPEDMVVMVYFLVNHSFTSGLQYEVIRQEGIYYNTLINYNSRLVIPSGVDAIAFATRNRNSTGTPDESKIKVCKSANSDIYNSINSVKSNMFNDLLSLSIFKKVGVIGDSISVGWAKDKNGNNSRRNTDISWVQQLARLNGSTWYNLGASGVDPIEWFDPNYEFAEYCYTQYQSVGACDLYIIGLGLNGGTLGSLNDIKADYTTNTSSFYGQYGRMIQMINAEHPDAIVICLTEPTERADSYDKAIRNIVRQSPQNIKAYLLDLDYGYKNLFQSPEVTAELQPDGLHYTPHGYTLIAAIMAQALAETIDSIKSELKYVGVTEV